MLGLLGASKICRARRSSDYVCGAHNRTAALLDSPWGRARLEPAVDSGSRRVRRAGGRL